MSNSAFVELLEAQIGYEHRPILEGVNLKLTDGDFLGLVGPNGAGKTTLLKALLGNLPILSGERKVRVAAPPRFGYVPQREALDLVFPLTVREVVGMGRFPHRGLFQRFSSEDRERIDWSLSKAGIEPLAERLYRDLSGGQKQRALIARALATEPEILVLDEPTAGMDLRSSKDLLDLIANLHDEGHLTVMAGAGGLVLLTHGVCRRPFMLVFYDPEMARTLGYRPQLWNWLFYLSLGVGIAAVTKVAGSLLTFSFLVVPAMTALAIANRMRTLMVVSILSAIAAAFSGLLLSYQFDLPTGPAMVMVSGALLLVAVAVGSLQRRLQAKAA